MLQAGGYVDGRNIPKLGRRNGTTYQHGRIMAEYTTRTGQRVMVAIHDDGHYGLYAGALVVIVQPNAAENTRYGWTAVGMVGVRVRVVVAFRKHAEACEFAKSWAEGLIKVPMIWFLPFDFNYDGEYAEGEINGRRSELLLNPDHRRFVTILPEVERISPDER